MRIRLNNHATSNKPSLYLRDALKFLESLKDEERVRAAEILEKAYHAGEHNFKASNPKAFVSDVAYELEEIRYRSEPRRLWTKKVLEFYRNNETSVKWWEVLKYLKSGNIAHWEGGHGGECEAKDAHIITFEDGQTEDKTRKQFQKSLSELKKRL